MKKLPIRCVAFDVTSTREVVISYIHASCLTKRPWALRYNCYYRAVVPGSGLYFENLR